MQSHAMVTIYCTTALVLFACQIKILLAFCADTKQHEYYHQTPQLPPNKTAEGQKHLEHLSTRKIMLTHPLYPSFVSFSLRFEYIIPS